MEPKILIFALFLLISMIFLSSSYHDTFAYPGEEVQISVTTDKASYKPGEILTIRGTGAHSYSIWAKIISPQGEEITELKFLAPKSGEFFTAWIIPKSIAQGIYTIEARDVVQKTITNFEIQSSQKLSSSTEPISQTPATIPKWVQDISSWWEQGLISDLEYLNAIEYLQKKGVISKEP